MVEPVGLASDQRVRFGHPNASSLRMILRSRNPPPKLRGTKPGERGTRCCSQRPRPARPTMDPKHQEAKLTKTLESQQQNGRRSHRSSTMGSVVARFSIVQWGAGSETHVDMLMSVLNVARIILGTATTEQEFSNPLPGVWLAPRGSPPEPKGTNDHVADPPVIVPKEDPPVWTSWKDVPKDPRDVAAVGRWFVEVFSGTARLTQTVQAGQVPCLPPIDITLCAAIPFAFDVVDLDQWQFFMQLIFFGCIFFAHFGTPCNSYSGARKDDGGPSPLRSLEFPDGLPALSDQNACIVFMGNLFNERTCEACIAIVTVGGDFSIENPLGSLIWETPSMRQLIWNARAGWVDLDQCAFGAPSRKPTRLILSNQRMQRSLHKTCPGNHVHEVLKGKVYSEQFKKVVYRTKLAQEYPWKLCQTMAKDIQDLWRSPLSHLEPSFDLQSSESRKRPVGQDIPWKLHRQRETALKALAAGYQLKRGALKPLIDVETDPGVAVQWALQIPHPFSVSEPLSADLQKAIDQVSRDPQKVNRDRELLLAEWSAKAAACLQESDQLLRRITDPHMRRLLRGVADDQPAKLGATSNIVLYQAFALEVSSPDITLAADLLSGFPIVGAILPSNRWPAYEKEQTIVSLQELHQRAWAIRHKIVQRVKGIPVSENLVKIWEATMEDVHEGSSLGPFRSEEEVTRVLGQEDWIPTQRFEVVQKNKVRGCDSATTNLINQATVITEKLQLPSTDTNVAALPIGMACNDQTIAGWVLDERKAYRQIPVKPDQRKFSVIVMKDPADRIPKFFVMVGHSFGLVSAVYNYNRRSAFINEVLVSLFGLVAFSFYDDKYGFEPASTAAFGCSISALVARSTL